MNIAPLPAAIVLIALESLETVDAALVDRLSEASNPYVLAWIGARRIGRSRVLDLADTTFRLDLDPAGFVHELAASGDVAVRVEIWDDADASGPIASVSGAVGAPFHSEKRTLEGTFSVTMTVRARRLPPPLEAVAPRVAEGTDSLATLRLVDAVAVTIENVRGLYRPTGTFAYGARAAVHVDGYTSEDDLGRIYLNRTVEGHWYANHQQIDVSVRIHVLRGILPEGAKVRWTVLDVDDPFNDDPGTHREAGLYCDHLDYDPKTGRHLGSRGHDNEGKPDYPPVWQAAGGHALHIESPGGARTDIRNGVSRVILHCPSLAGDNLALKVEIVADGDFESFPAFTGIMTMWNRFDVENVRMKSAASLPFEVPFLGFRAACIQIDVQPERVVPDQDTLGKTEATYRKNQRYSIARHLKHHLQPGWLAALAALEAWPLPEPGPPLDVEIVSIGRRRDAPIDAWDVIRLRGDFSDEGRPKDVPRPYRFTLRWEEEDAAHEAEFLSSAPIRYLPEEGVSICRIPPHDINNDFTPHDWGSSKKFGLRWQSSPSGSRTGYALPWEGVSITVDPEGNRPLRGETLGGRNLTRPHGAGQVLIFTRAIAKALGAVSEETFRTELGITLFHELTHSVDSPHMCGAWNYETGRRSSCVMNYQGQWLCEPDPPTSGKLIPDTERIPQAGLCARHIKVLRRTHMEDNPALRWK
jgi:hypothetical protein